MSIHYSARNPNRIFTPEEDALILEKLKDYDDDFPTKENNPAALAKLFKCGRQTVLNRLYALLFGKASQTRTLLPCMRCRTPFPSVDRCRHRLCEQCSEYADDAARSVLL